MISVLLLAITLNCDLRGQDINKELSSLFFNVDVTHLSSSLLELFDRDTTLHKTSAANDTVFSPLKSKGIKYLASHTFAFQKNSYLNTQFKDGVLGLILGEDTEDSVFSVLFIAFEFKNKSRLDKAYSELLGKFEKLGVVEFNQNFTGTTAIVTNYSAHKRVELLNILFPQKDAEQFILYVYVKQLKKER